MTLRKFKRNGRNGRNGHRQPPARQEAEEQEISPLDEMPDDGGSENELNGPWRTLFRPKLTGVPMAEVARIPRSMVLPLCIQRMQTRICSLTGGPGDPDLMEQFERDFEELSIGIDGQGREEGLTLAAAEGIDAEEDDGPTPLWGTLRK